MVSWFLVFCICQVCFPHQSEAILIIENGNSDKNGTNYFVDKKATNRRAASLPILTWVFISTHKTGTHLVAHSFRDVYSQCQQFGLTWRIDFTGKFNRTMTPSFASQYDLIHASHPYGCQENWLKEYETFQGRLYRFIHIVRDPMDRIMSSYLYHTQEPSPETWLQQPPEDFCMYLYPSKSTMIHAFGRYKPSLASTIPLWYDNLINDCEGVLQSLPTDVSIGDIFRQNYSDAKLSFVNGKRDLYPGIRIQAYEALKYDLSMVHRFMYEDPRFVRHYFTEEFPAANPAEFTKTTKQIMDFLYEPWLQHKESIRCRLCECVNKDIAIQRIVKKGMPTVIPTNRTTGKFVHITQGFMNKEEREYYKNRLSQDSVLGPILSLMSEILRSNFSIMSDMKNRLLEL